MDARILLNIKLRIIFSNVCSAAVSLSFSPCSYRSQYVVVDGCLSNLVDVVSGVPQVRALEPLLFPLYTSEHSLMLEV